MDYLLKLKNRFTGGNENEVDGSADAQRNILVGQGNPDYMEVRRRGEGWNVITSTAFAPLAALPTTTARLELYNNGSRLMVVSDLHGFQLLSTTVVQSGYSVWAMISTLKAVPTLTAQTIYSMSGKPFTVPTATSEIVTGVGTTVVANGWQAYGNNSAFGLAAATPGASFHVPVDGKLMVPPGASLCLQMVGPVATASSFQMGVTFDLVKAAVES